MKHIVAILAAMICLPLTSMAAVNAEQITSNIKTRFADLCRNEEPTVMEMPSGPYKYTAILARQGISLHFDEQGVLASANWAPKPDIYPEIGYDENLVWSLRPDFNKDNMINIYGTIYRLKRSDGLVDARVQMIIMKREGLVTGFAAVTKANDKPLPSINVSEGEAMKLATNIAQNWVISRRDGNHEWRYVYEDRQTKSTGTVHNDVDGNPYVEYSFGFYLSDKEVSDISDYLPPNPEVLPLLSVSINATTGDVNRAYLGMVKRPDVRIGTMTNKSATKLPVADVTINKKATKLGFPCVQADGQTYVPLNTIQALAKGHTVTAKADAKAFKLDGNELALPAKVLSRKGVLYLPWQSLNSLPGVKAMFDAKLAKLDITTASATAAK